MPNEKSQMTVVHAQFVGDNALVPKGELDRLLDLARRSEHIELQVSESDWPATDIMRLAQAGGAFEFWNEEGENIYSLEDGKPV
jgi:hypothetical protein